MARRGMTVVEIMVVVFLFATVAGLASELYLRSVDVERRLGTKLDQLHHAQLASLHLSRELRQASDIIAPPEGATKTRPYVMFVNEQNEIITIYVNEQGQLVRQNHNDNDSVTVLASGVDRLRVARKGHRLVNYHVHLEDPVNKQKFDLISGICIRNSVH